MVAKLKEGVKVALVSDAGMPAISDPGYELVEAAVKERLTVVPLPGANAAITALIASGLRCQPFYFYGFLQRQKREKKKELEILKKQASTVIFYESPHRLKETLAAVAEVFGNRKMVLCRELTKKYEEFIRGTVMEAIQWAEQDEIRGEFCLIVDGADETETAEDENWWKSLSIEEHVNHYISTQDISSKEAIKLTAKDRGLHKRDVYQAFHLDHYHQ